MILRAILQVCLDYVIYGVVITETWGRK